MQRSHHIFTRRSPAADFGISMDFMHQNRSKKHDDFTNPEWKFTCPKSLPILDTLQKKKIFAG